MIHFQKKVLKNGLRVIVNEDTSTPLVGVSVLYDVGSRDEDPNRTGFAHLFEHLMFAGSANAPDFDGPIQNAGGENNAFTTNDYTNFYEVLPVQNIETVLWLESDRMQALHMQKRELNVQRKVVNEEFKETCLGEPYGDCWHHLCEMMYAEHPYRWPVIGLIPEHVTEASIEEVRDFYKRWYHPGNAMLAISGNIESEKAFGLAEKWFGDIAQGDVVKRNHPKEKPLTAAKIRILHADVSVPNIYIAFHCPERLHADYYAADIITDILSQGNSSRLYLRLVKEQKLFASIDAYLTGTHDAGLLVVEGKPAQDVEHEVAIKAIWEELEVMKKVKIDERELQKLLNHYESTTIFSEINVMTKAQNLTYYELLGDANLVNTEIESYRNITPTHIHRVANEILRPNASCTLVYLPK